MEDHPTDLCRVTFLCSRHLWSLGFLIRSKLELLCCYAASMLLTMVFNSTNSSTKTAPPGTTRHHLAGVNPTGSRHHRRPRRPRRPRPAPEPRRTDALGLPGGDAARRRGVLGRGVLWGPGPGGYGPGAGELGVPRGGGGWSGMEVEKS